MTRLQEHYKEIVRPELMSAFSYGNQMEVPKIEKIVINIESSSSLQILLKKSEKQIHLGNLV